MSEVLKRSLAVLGLMVLLIIVPMTMLAQSTTEGAVGGTVTDVSGAVVPNATVKVRNIGTNAEMSAVTDASGFFRVIRLQPATYEVSVTAQGFAAYKTTNVIVNVGTLTEIAPQLKPAGSSETVEVQGEAPMVNTNSAEFARVVNEVAIKNLPINGGRWSSFVLLTPGVVNDSSGFGLVSFRGMSTLQNNNTLDGADNNQAFFAEERGRTRIGYSSPKAAVQEFQVNTSNYSAEFGRAAGGVVNTVTKSGTNDVHGELYFFDRDNAWGARNAYTTITTKDADGKYTPKSYKPKDWRKMTGFAVGGPIKKDKLFFHLTYDYYTRNFPGTGVASKPDAFFATPSAGTINTLATRLGLTAAQATQLYNDDLAALATTIGPTPRTGESFIWLPKVDWQINAKHRMSFVLNRMRWTSPAGIQTQATNTYGTNSFGNDYVKVTWGTLKLTSSLTNNVVNEFRSQYGRDLEIQTPQQPTNYEKNNLVKSALFPAYTNPLGLPPELSINNGWTLGVANFLTRAKYPDERRQQYADTISWSNGKHLFKAGADYTHVLDDTSNLRYQYGSFSYTGNSAMLNYLTDLHRTDGCSATVKVSGVDVTRAVPCYSSMNQAFGPMGFKFSTNDYGIFLQDDWRVLSRLTLTLGVRYDYQQMPKPFGYLFNQEVPQTATLPKDVNNFGPRVGFAWDMFGDGKTSLRGGYSMVYGRTINSTIYNALINTGMPGGQFQYTLSPTSASTTWCTNAAAFPKIYASEAELNAVDSRCKAGKSVVFFDPNFEHPSVHHVTLSLDREVMPNTVLQLSYLGSFGRNLPNFVDTNIKASTGTKTYTVCGVNSNGATDPASCGILGAGQPIQTATVTVPFYTARINSNYGSMTKVTSDTSSSYNALAVQLNRRMTNHIQYTANFTWSHAIDYGQNNTTFSSSNALLDPFDLKGEKGNSNQNVPKRFVVSAVFESPWKVNGWLGNLTNDWQIAPMYQWQNGLPYSARTSGTPSGGIGGGVNGSNGDFRIPGTRNKFRQPDTHVVDFKLSKSVKYQERYSVELSAEVFNALNHQNVTGVGTTGYFVGTTTLGGVSTPTLTYNTGVFGVANNSNSNFAYSPRQVQLGVKVKF